MKITRTIIAMAMATLCLASCQKEASFEGKTVRINASMSEEIATKTIFGDKEGTTYPSLWTKNKNVNIHVGTNAPVAATPEKAGASTTFTATLAEATSGVLRVFSPVGVYNSSDASKNVGGFTQKAILSSYTYANCILPAEQTPLEGSCDEAAHLVAASMDIPAEGVPSSIDMDFKLANAYGKLVIKNFEANNITQVVVTFPTAVVGTSCHYMLATGEINNANGKTITLNTNNLSKNADGNFEVWFGCVPAEMTSGTISLTITANGSNYTKSSTLSADKTLSFTTGKVKVINVDMNGAGTPSEDDTWALVTSTSSLTEGDVVVLANFEKKVTATTISSAIMGQVTSTFSEDGSTITELGEGTVQMTLEKSDNNWKLNTDSGYLGATAVKKVAFGSGTQTWTISVASNGDATVQNTTSGYGRFLYNVGNPRFTTYASSTTVSETMLLPQLYRKVAGSGSETTDPDEPEVFETVVENDGATSVGKNSATLNASYEYAAAVPYEAVFMWGLSEENLDQEAMYQKTLTSKSGTFSATLSDLAEGTTYYVKPYIVVKEGDEYVTYYGEVSEFTTFASTSVSTPGVPKWFELPAQADSDENGIDDNNSDFYYSWTRRADAPAIRNFSACYSKSKIHPVWSAAPLHSCYKGSSGRNNAYQNDPKISCTQSSKFDGYTRGHMLGSSDRTVSKPTNKQVFYYSNIGAQISSGFNTGGGAWNNLEALIDGQFCSDTLYQVVGCIFDDFTDKYGTTINAKKGTNGGGAAFQVPTAWYAVILRTKSGNSGKRVDQCSADELKCAAFILAHKSNAGHKPTSKDMYTVAELEEMTGLNYFVNVPNAPKSTANASDWNL